MRNPAISEKFYIHDQSLITCIKFILPRVHFWLWILFYACRNSMECYVQMRAYRFEGVFFLEIILVIHK